MASFEDTPSTTAVVDNDDERISAMFYRSITKDRCNDLLSNDYTIIDNFLGEDLSMQLLRELQDLTTTGKMIPNRTSFINTKTGKPSIIAKPGIFEVDLHDESIRITMNMMNKLFIASKSSLIEALMKYLSDSMQLTSGDMGRTIKLQHNQGKGGCFPYHYDNPGLSNKRCLTCILYLNLNWKVGDGGELLLQPFLQPTISIQPLFDRLVIFKSNSMLHRVEKTYKERFCCTFWIDGDGTNSPENTELRLAKSAIEDIDNTVKMLQKSPLQRSLSRFVYQEEYEESLYDCMEGSDGCDEMIASHIFHVKSIDNNIPLRNLVEALRNWRTDHQV